ncbi:MAG: ACP S-malonyltransferase [Candidatus Marinimicrobia bacterium]|jgi:[acyl-carrier-protein] S-malonyltransferase|nr:ACP S-malonyltransferase [Candidatus Neomarinimicrobiota bacterium]MDP7437482.1 ACP S-malonyltransferase [Candidatus Neomarinimicrobiota bacterium]|tara:strand:- start:19 stop:939 length:921 start_codon:yes stop_codon:yes gene_type:complete
MGIGFLCPGQASQKVGMGLDLYENSTLGKQFFDTANDIMGVDIQHIIFNGPEEELKQTQFTQPAIYIVSVIIGMLMLENGIQPSCAAGHSLGEYSALTLAKSFDFETGLNLVKVRAEGMQFAGTQNPGTMAAVIGLDDETTQNICNQYSNGIVVAANFNAKGQVVISGEVDAVHAVMPLLKDAGAMKVIELNVSGAFHSPLMTPAKEMLSEMLLSIEIRDSEIPVYANVTASPVSNKDEIRQSLIDQLENPVRWHESITRMIKDGMNHGVEIGPGRVLQGLSRRIDRSFDMSGVESLEQIVNFNYV